MNQVTQMFRESNSRMKKIMAGSFRADEIAAAQREFEGQIKLVNAVISAFAIQSKNKRAMDGLNKMNIMDDGVAIDLGLGDPNTDKVKCPYHDHLITRAECLDFSGQAANYDKCKGCDIGRATKAALLPVT